jgi:hypothetical protein
VYVIRMHGGVGGGGPRGSPLSRLHIHNMGPQEVRQEKVSAAFAERHPRLIRQLRNFRLRISLPFMSYEITPGDFLTRGDIDERIEKLGTIKQDLLASIAAIEELQVDAQGKKRQVDELQTAVQQIEQDRATAETLLHVPEESFARVLGRAAAQGRWRGLVEGTLIGFLTGAASSFVVWYLTKS